ncbi:uncharacterized protein LOC132196829 isoform X2 [Neocloeon triangulifer]|uniref:uncharacterized protein LOC132196829 isoform X2 n=1 Tax=Neocloeon triangulifer TaxID=2078957 RepID=UPI00286F1FB5|nr:uncharacterized protein LOC132196829 isoform X2 [Neocloeon triangulifer]
MEKSSTPAGRAGMPGCRKWFFGMMIFGAGAVVYLLQGSPSDISREMEQIYTHSEAAIISITNETDSPPKSSLLYAQDNATLGIYLINTEGCKIPDMPVKNSMISKFTKDVQPTPECDKDWWPLHGKTKARGPALVQSDLDSLYLGSLAKNLSCCYRPFTRATPGTPGVDNKAIYSKECIPFKNRDRVSDNYEFVRVECYNSSKRPDLVYKDFHAFVPLKRNVEERCTDSDSSRNQISVAVLGIDSVSRLNMHRELPLTLQTLQMAGAVPLLGYNKVADNTFPNLMPLLTGISESDLIKGCPWPGPDHVLDACPFIWKEYAIAGYRTVYAEDCTWMTTFNYAKSGFLHQPTDYYARPFLQNTEEQIGHLKKWNVKLCSGPRLTINNILSYAQKVSQRFESSNWFGLFWSNSVSHDVLTMPHIGDKAFSSLVSKIDFNRTALVFISDHGMRWGPIRDTYQGWLESCLPAAFVVLPPWFETEYPEAVKNLRLNGAARLTTPFDLHATLRDLINPDKSLLNPSITAKGISLFRPIPENRTCESASIPETYCTCQASKPLETRSVPDKAIEAILATLNSALMSAPECAPLTLKYIISARVMGQHHLQLTLQTQPGDGHFQGTVSKVADGRFEVQGPISRMNQYGNSSWCVSSYLLKPVCYCL